MKKVLLNSILLLCALIVGSGSLWATEVTLTISSYADANSWTDTKAYTSEIAINSDISVTCVGGGNNGKYYVSNESWRHYEGDDGAITISTSSGTLSSITFNYDKNNNGTLKYGGSNYASGAACTAVSGLTSATFTVERTSGTKNGNVQITSIVVNYTPASASSVDAPEFSPSSGAIAAGSSVTLTQASADQIKYTTDGTDPSKTAGTTYTVPIVITTPTTIKAIAIEGDEVSSVSAASYTISVDKPTFDVSSGKVNLGTLLTITAAAGYTIIYTTDGTAPSYANSNGEIYDDPIEINQAMTVKAIAVDEYDNESAVSSADYTVNYPGGVDITPNYTFFGKSKSFSGTDYAEVSGTQEGVTITYSKGTNDNTYASSSAMRFYSGNTLKIDAQSGKTITTVIFTVTSGTDNMTSSPDGYSTSTHTWSGNSSSITFTRSGSSYLQFTNITIVLGYVITPTPNGYATFFAPSSAANVQIPSKDDSDNDITVVAYTGTYSAGVLTLNALTGATSVIPKNNPVVLKSSNGNAFTLTPTFAAGGTTGDNDLHGTSEQISTPANSYVLGYQASTTAFYPFIGANIPANKAYLTISGGEALAAGIRIIENENNATNIEAINATEDAVKFIQNGKLFIKKNGVVYDMMGAIVK